MKRIVLTTAVLISMNIIPDTFAVETSNLALAIASSAGKAKVCGFSEAMSRTAFENIGLLMRCAVEAGEFTESQADEMMLRAAEVYNASLEEANNLPQELCEAMQGMVEKFAAVQAC